MDAPELWQTGGLSLPVVPGVASGFQTISDFWGFMAQRLGNEMLNLFISNLYWFKSSLVVTSDLKFTSRQRERADMSNLTTTRGQRWSPPGSRALECFLQVVCDGGGIVTGPTWEHGWGVCVRCVRDGVCQLLLEDQVLWSLSSPVPREDRR